MAITYSAMAPIAETPAGATGSIPVQNFSVSSHVKEADIVVLSGGTIATATANVAGGIAGIAQHDSDANYGGQSPTNPYVLGNVFGVTQVGTLLPPSEGQTIVAMLGAPVQVEINLTNVTGWVSGGTFQANFGTTVGLAIDGTTGFFTADPNASNKVAEITGKVNGPFAVPGNDVGNLGARVIIKFNASALAVS